MNRILKYLSNLVSIPLWFDWKLSRFYPGVEIVPFQFHFGSIGSPSPVSLLFVRRGFNSTLVRLEAVCRNP